MMLAEVNDGLTENDTMVGILAEAVTLQKMLYVSDKMGNIKRYTTESQFMYKEYNGNPFTELICSTQY
ncbi:hypothetical protein Y032_0146g2549 [Ancylostoma ceylanicum]|uniref:Uncharacterized protein n=1 Tax=Ancylostoma ceylanicum TaxID=53326 RepID=A0A016T2Q9_9BILA|nr:hypothetical protein Y032_0146g2549 [Ancylostoma ceylanicum]